MKRVSLALMAAAMAVGGLSGCVSRAEYDKVCMQNAGLVEERNRLRIDNETLKARLDGELANSATLRTQLASMQSLLNDANAQVARLQAMLAEQKPGDIIVHMNDAKLPAALNEALKKFADKYGLEYDPKSGVVRFSSDLLFDLGKTDVKAEHAKLLAEFANIINMAEAQPFEVLIVGHTDNVRIARPETRERTPTNWHLSAYRAVAVLQVLEKNAVSAKRMAAMGFGQERPGVANKAGGTPENRRVEVYLVPGGSLGGSTPDTGSAPAVDKAVEAPAKPALLQK